VVSLQTIWIITPPKAGALS